MLMCHGNRSDDLHDFFFLYKNHTLSYVIALIGRFVIGIGKDTLFVWRNVAISDWFIGQEFGMAFGFAASTTRLGVITGLYLVPYLTKVFFGFEWVIGLLLWLISLTAVLIFAKFQAYANNLASSEFISKETFIERFRWKSFKKLEPRFWIVCILIMLIWVSKGNFNRVLKNLIHQEYKFDTTDAIYISSLFYIVPVILSPIVGLYIDRYGRQITLITISWIVYSIAFAMVLVPFGEDKKYIWVLIIVLFGFSYSLYNVWLWTCITLVVRSNVIGTGFGIFIAARNVGVAFSPLLLEFLVDSKDTERKYDNLIILFLVCSVMALILSLVLYYLNERQIRNRISQVDRCNTYTEKLTKYQKDLKTDIANTTSSEMHF